MTWLARVVVAALLAATLGTPAVAQQPAPGPKGTETSEVRKKPKKKPAAPEAQKPKGAESPDAKKPGQ